MPLGVYLDESGTNPDDVALTIGGFISSDDRSAVFSERWKAALVGWNLRYWHMADFEARQGEFRDWPRDEESRRRLQVLLDLIKEHALALIGVTFPRTVFRDFFALRPEEKENYLLYRMAAGSALLSASLFVEERMPGEECRLIFETGMRGGRGYVKDAYDSLEKGAPGAHEHFHFLSLTFAAKEDFEPLQAADIMAYETFRHSQTTFGSSQRPVRYPLRTLLEGIPSAYYVVDRDTL